MQNARASMFIKACIIIIEIIFCLFVFFFLFFFGFFFFLLFMVPVMSSFCGNMILKIALLQRPTAVASSAGSSPLLMHDSFSAHYHPTLIPSYPGSHIWWRQLCGGRGSGYYKAGVSMLWLAGGIPLICCDYYRVRPCTPPPHSARPDSIHTQQCAVSVPGRISALHREERISATTHLICIHVPREPHEHPGLHLFCIKPGTPITEAPLDLLSLLWEDLIGTSFFPFWTPLIYSFLSFKFTVCCLWCLFLIGTMQVIFDIDLLWASKSFSFIFLGLFHWVCSFIWCGRPQHQHAI